QTLEFKEAKVKFDTNKRFQYCVARSNEGGGHLLLGIEDRPPRNVVGSAAFSNTVKIGEPACKDVRGSATEHFRRRTAIHLKVPRLIAPFFL
ncbi:MAG: RNA-binding domain-containing protein, partial [Rhodothermales bacterium]